MFLPVSDFRRILEAGEARFPTKQAFAKALGITPSRYSRVKAGDAYSLNVVNCLRLARLSGEPAPAVLRAAGKGDVADLIEELYRPGQVLSAAQRAVLELWDRVPPERRATVEEMLGYAARVAPHHAPNERTPSRRRMRARKATEGRRGQRPKGEPAREE